LQMPQYLINADGSAYPMTALPQDPQLGPLAGMPLPVNHQEENISGATNRSMDLFFDGTWRILPRLRLTGGIRSVFEKFSATNQSLQLEGSPSTLGMLTGMYPNLFFKMADETGVSKKWSAVTYRASLIYELHPDATLFLGYSKGRRPHVIQFDSQGTPEIMNQEILHSYDAGFKTAVSRRIWVDVTFFHQLFRDFQTSAWVNNNYLVQDAGKAKSNGIETSLKIALLKNLDLFVRKSPVLRMGIKNQKIVDQVIHL